VRARRPPLRAAVASRLRDIADGLEPPERADAGHSRAMLIRLGGRWWYRDEIVSPMAEETKPDVQLLP
jgi:hypothetical protein